MFQRMHLKFGSVERVFDSVRREFPRDVEAQVASCSLPGRGVWRRIYGAFEAALRQGEVNHITGDVHYLALVLPYRRTILTVLDCVSLERLRGIRWLVFYLIWYWLPVRRAAIVTVISESTKRELLCHVPCNPDKIRVVQCPCFDEFKPHAREFNSKCPRILQIGTGPNKNLLRVIDALRGISCQLRIVGVLSPEQKQRLQEAGIDFSVVSGISDDEMVKEYRDCDLVVFASTYEGFGLPIVEANATGRPVVTSNTLSMPEVAGEAACLVDPLDVADIRAGILRVIDDSDYRHSLVEHGFKNVERFRPAAIAEQYAKLYRELKQVA